MRPILQFLNQDLLKSIVFEAYEILCKLGINIHNVPILKMLSDHGAKIDIEKSHVIFSPEIIRKALKTVKSSVQLFDVLGNKTHELSGHNVHFTPGSAAINILDGKTQKIRKPTTEDYVKYAKVVSRLDNLASQSTAFIPSDVHENFSDSFRLFLSLMFCEKPVVTGAFRIQSFEVMKNMQLAIRGSKEELKAKPLTIFSCCPTSPLKWGDITSQNLVDCAKYSIPVEYISMPLSGFVAPVTLVGSLVQHTAETLSGVIMSQLTNPGTPVLYGGSPAAFDVRYETTPMGAIETQMIDCAYNEIGKFFRIPTQAYIGLSDSKQLDAQAGLETSMGATLATLSGINNISGAGMLDFENCQSLEKLVLDNEISGMLLRMVKGIEPKGDFPALPIFQELLKEKHLLISKHSRKYLKEEHYFPGKIINRANLARWNSEGATTLSERASGEVEQHLRKYQPSRLSSEIKNELTSLMLSEAGSHGVASLPSFAQ